MYLSKILVAKYERKPKELSLDRAINLIELVYLSGDYQIFTFIEFNQ